MPLSPILGLLCYIAEGAAHEGRCLELAGRTEHGNAVGREMKLGVWGEALCEARSSHGAVRWMA